MRRPLHRWLVGATAVAVALAWTPVASAETKSIRDFLKECPAYGDDGELDPDARQRVCTGEVPSFDGTPLDVDLTLPFNENRARRHPLIVMMNGFSSDKHEWQSVTDEGDDADKWHWNSHWFAKHGYYVLTYTPRGFESDPPEGYSPQTPHTTSESEPNGKIELKSREFEVRDTQWLAALATDAFEVDPEQIAVTGGSYGGGESWLQASQARWTFPAACSTATASSGPEACRDDDRPEVGELPLLELQAAVPKYPWSDLAYSLAPNGHPGPETNIYESAQHRPTKEDDQPCFANPPVDQPAGEERLCNPIGTVKKSYVDFFYGLGNLDGTFADGLTTTPAREGPINVHCWKARADGAPFFPIGVPPAAGCAVPTSGDPYDTAGGEDSIVQQLRDGLTVYRGAYYQDERWQKQAAGRKVAVYSIQGWTDDLFPAVESFRMFKYLKRLHPRWPVEVEVADVGHPRAQNRPEQWRRLNKQAFNFVQAHIEGSHEQETIVRSEPTLCENDGEPDSNETAALRVSAQSPEGLSRGALEIGYTRPGATKNPDTDPNGPATDPLAATLPPCRTPAGSAPYTAVSAPLPDHATYVGLGKVRVAYELKGATTATLHARVWDVAPDGTTLLMTRGTYRIDVPAYDTQSGELELPLFGNHWPLKPGHSIRLDLTQVDADFLRPSNEPSSIDFAPPSLMLPTREAGTRTLGGG